MKPKNPIQADKRWIKGFANMPPALPILCWKEMRVKVKKNTMEKATERPMKTGVVAAGAESSTVGALFGRTETSGWYVSSMGDYAQARGRTITRLEDRDGAVDRGVIVRA